MKEKESIYIITKPLQYINATNILNNSKKTCLLVNYFDNSKKFFEDINKKSTYWSKSVWCKDRYEAFFYVLKNKNKFDTLYIDTDMGTLNRFFLTLLYPLKIIIYEEGFGNYRAQIREKKTGYKKVLNLLDSLTGPNYLGGFKNTKEIYLHHPNAFFKLVDKEPNKKILNFNTSFEEHLSSLKEVSYSLPSKVEESIKNKNVLLYLTARNLDQNFKEVLKKYKDYYKILKPHPQLVGDTGFQDFFDCTIEHQVLAELLINNLLQQSVKVTVLHHGDTTLLNLKENKNLVYVNISKNAKQINMFKKIEEVIKK